MKTLLFFAVAVGMLVSGAVSAGAADGPVRHVVSLKFKKDADPERVRQVEAAFGALKEKISQIQQLEWGTNASPEDRAKGFTHIWVATFKDAADRDAYLVHPAHKAFAGGLKDVVEDVFVFDFVPKG